MSVSGHEQRFRQLFAEEAAGRLDRLASAALELETGDGHAADPAFVDAMFREAHSLKGGAAVVGLRDVGRVAHAFEDVLAQLRSGARRPTPEFVDGLLAAVDGFRALLTVTVRGHGHGHGADADTLVVALRAQASDVEVLDSRELRLPEPVGIAAAPAPVSVAVTPQPQAAPRASGRGTLAGEPDAVRIPRGRLDELTRLVTESASAQLRVARALSDSLGVDPDALAEFRELSDLLGQLQQTTMRARMVPVAAALDPLRRAVRDVARTLGKQVRWELVGGETELDRGVLDQLGDPLLHLVRNAVGHGVETPEERVAAGKDPTGVVRLTAAQRGSEVVLALADDGCGIDVERVRDVARLRGHDMTGLDDHQVARLVFSTGLSTARAVTDLSGRGVGLDVVSTVLQRIRGRVEVRSTPGAGTEFRVAVPLTLAVLPCILVEAGGRQHALPLHTVVTALPAGPGGLVHVDRQALAPTPLAAALGLDPARARPDPLLAGTPGGAVIVLTDGARCHAFEVDAVGGQRDVVVKGLSRLLPPLQAIAGGSVEPDGSILLVLEPAGLIDRTAHGHGPAADPAPSALPAVTGPARVLVADDDALVRELQHALFSSAGYEVTTCADGAEALAELHQRWDLVVTDLEMPRMDGLDLTRRIRTSAGTRDLPILVLTSRDDEDHRSACLAAGANAYVLKSEMHGRALLALARRLMRRST